MALKEKYEGQVEFVIADVDDPQGRNLATEYKVDTIPTFRFIDRDGVVIDSYTGVVRESVLEQFIVRLLE